MKNFKMIAEYETSAGPFHPRGPVYLLPMKAALGLRDSADKRQRWCMNSYLQVS